MLNRFSTVVQSAVDSFSSSTLLDDFLYHWKMVLKYYDEIAFNKKAVQNTNIPPHLDQMLKILIQEEEELQDSGSTGPCLEYFLYHKFLDILVALAVSDCPPGMRQAVLIFVRKLISRVRQPILPHSGVYPAIRQLMMMCDGRLASPTEADEISFLCTLCAMISKDPQLINIFCCEMKMEDCETEEFEMKNPSLLECGSEVTCNNSETESEHAISPISEGSQSLIETKSDGGNSLEQSTTDFYSNETTVEEQTGRHYSSETPCVLLDNLSTFICSADSSVRTKACEGIMVVASLPFDQHASSITQESNLCRKITSHLQTLFEAIPQEVDPVEVDEMTVNWGYDTPAWDEGTPFPGCRELASFFAWLDYCNQLVCEARSRIGSFIARSIRKDFLEEVVNSQLILAEDHHKITLLVLLKKMLKIVSAPCLLEEFAFWCVGESREPELPHVATLPVMKVLLDCCLDSADEVSLVALQIFEILLEKPCEHIVHNLVLVYLNKRAYYDSAASDSFITSWSDEEDERERHRDIPSLDFSAGSSPVSRIFAPRSIHKVINSFLFLIPQHMQTTSSEESGYEQYIQDANKQYQTLVAQCSSYNWPLETTFPETHESDDSCSSDSRPEDDHEKHFYEGPFLKMLFTRLLQLPYQSYQINLRLTGLVSRLAMLPHSYLHEYILNPMLPVVADSTTLFTVLQVVAEELTKQISKIPDYKHILSSTRLRLLGEDESGDENNTFFDSFIVLEEFCKELASIAFIKYHNFS